MKSVRNLHSVVSSVEQSNRGSKMSNNQGRTTEPVVVIDWLGGNCPVQAEGTVMGKRSHFRARGEQWSLAIGGEDLCGEAEWEHRERFGEWPDAGWMTPEQAETFLREAAARYADGKPGARPEDDPAWIEMQLERHASL